MNDRLFYPKERAALDKIDRLIEDFHKQTPTMLPEYRKEGAALADELGKLTAETRDIIDQRETKNAREISQPGFGGDDTLRTSAPDASLDASLYDPTPIEMQPQEGFGALPQDVEQPTPEGGFFRGAFEIAKGLPVGGVSGAGTSLQGTAAFAERLKGFTDEDRAAARQFYDRVQGVDASDPQQFNALVNELRALPPKVAKEAFPGVLAMRAGTIKPDQMFRGAGLIRHQTQYPELEVGRFVPDAKTIPGFEDDFRNTPTYRLGDSLKGWDGGEYLSAGPGYENSWQRKGGEALGSILPLMAASYVNPAVGFGASIGMGVGEQIDRAIAAGATKQQITDAIFKSAGVGMTEMLPIEILLQASPATGIGGRLIALAKQAAAEGLQEVSSEFLQNAIEKTGYNPDKSLAEGLGESAIYGGGVGGVLEAGKQILEAALPGRARVRGASQPDAAQDTADAVTGPNEPAAPQGGLVSAPRELPPPDQRDVIDGVLTEDGLERVPEIIDAESTEVDPDPGLPPTQERKRLSPPVQDFSDTTREFARELGIDLPVLALPDQSGDGTREKPIEATTPEAVDVAAEKATEPTEAQKEAGNYQKGHIRAHGLDITIENAKGSERKGVDSDGEAWSVTMPAHYGYFKRSEGADGDQVDVYIGPEPDSDFVAIVDQVDPDTGKFDESKVILGTADADEAKALYEAGFSDGRGPERMGNITTVPMDEFKGWLADGDTKAPFAPLEEQSAPEHVTEAEADDGAEDVPAEQDMQSDLAGKVPKESKRDLIPENERAEFDSILATKDGAEAPTLADGRAYSIAPEGDGYVVVRTGNSNDGRRGKTYRPGEIESFSDDIWTSEQAARVAQFIAHNSMEARNARLKGGRQAETFDAGKVTTGSDLEPRPDLGPLFDDPKSGAAQRAVLQSVKEGRRSTKELQTTSGAVKWLLRNGYAETKGRGKKLQLTEKGEQELAGLSETVRAEQEKIREAEPAGQIAEKSPEVTETQTAAAAAEEKPQVKSDETFPLATDTPAAVRYVIGRVQGNDERMRALLDGNPTDRDILDEFNEGTGSSKTSTSLERGSISATKSKVRIMRPNENGDPERVEIAGKKLAAAIREAYADAKPPEVTIEVEAAADEPAQSQEAAKAETVEAGGVEWSLSDETPEDGIPRYSAEPGTDLGAGRQAAAERLADQHLGTFDGKTFTFSGNAMRSSFLRLYDKMDIDPSPEADALANQTLGFEADDSNGFMVGVTAPESTVDALVTVAKRHGGTRKGRGGPRFVFDTAENRAAFVDEAGKLSRPPGERYSLGPVFYSALTTGVEGLKPEKAPAKDWKNLIAKLPGVRKDEVDWTGVEQWLDEQSGSIGKADVVAYLKANEISIEETVLGRDDKPGGFMAYRADERDGAYFVTSLDGEGNPIKDVAGPFEDEAQADLEAALNNELEISGDPTRHNEYTLPGGENYRELLLRLPQRGSYGANLSIERADDGEYRVVDDATGKAISGPSSEADARREMERLRNQSPDFYKAAHFDQPNVLVHARFNERVTEIPLSGKELADIEKRKELKAEYARLTKELGDAIRQRDAEYRRYERQLYDELKGYVTTGDMTMAEMTRRIEQMEYPETATARRMRALQKRRDDLNMPDEPRRRQAKTLFIEEIQSDWGQALRRDPDAAPDMPFKDTKAWAGLAFKRMIRWAVDNGFERIAWTPGEVQADRYDLSKQVKQIIVERHGDKWVKDGPEDSGKLVSSDRYFYIKGYDHRDNPVLRQEVKTQEEMAGVIGKDLAERAMQQIAKSEEAGSVVPKADMRGTDLKIGGEGMQAFYDAMLPQAVNKIVKKWGAKVGVTEVETAKEAATSVGDFQNWIRAHGHPPEAGRQWQDDGPLFRKYLEDRAAPRQKVHYIDVTPAMRESVLRGQPMRLDAGQPMTLTPDASNRYDEIRRAVEDVVSRMAPGIRSTIDFNMDYAGRYSAEAALISVAFRAVDPEGTARHEVIHALRATGVLSDKEFRLLREEARKRGWRGLYKIDERYREAYADDYRNGDVMEEVLDEEAIADAFAAYESGERFSGTIGKLFKRLSDFLARIRNALSGLGFQTAEDIFQRIESGEVGNREQRLHAQEVRYRLGEDMLRGVQGLNPFQAKANKEPFADWFNEDGTFRRAKAIQSAMQDYFLGVKAVQRIVAAGMAIPDAMNTYVKEEMYYRRVQNNIEALRDEVLEPLIDAMDKAKVSEDLLDAYLYARHAIERNEHIASFNARFPDGGSGMTNAQAEELMNEFRKAGLTDKLEGLAEMVDKANAMKMDLMVSEGLISQDAADEMRDRFPHYVPLKGTDIDTKDWAASMGMGRGFSVSSSGLKRALGRNSLAKGILANVVADYRRISVTAEKNRVNKAFYDFTKEFPDERFYKADAVKMKRVLVKRDGFLQGQKVDVPDYIFNSGAEMIDKYIADPMQWLDKTMLPVMIDGKRHYIEINNPELYNALTRAGAGGKETWVLEMAFAANRILARAFTSWNPDFVIPNFTRDVQAAGINMLAEEGKGVAGQVVKDSFRAIRGTAAVEMGKDGGEWGRLYRELNDLGGLTGYSNVARNVEDVQAEIDLMLRDAAGKAGPVDHAKQVGHKLDRFAQAANNVFENATRVATYKAMLEAGKTKQQAASAAKNITVNFNRRGTNRWLGALYLFSNPTIQGNYRMMQALMTGKNGRKVMAGMIGSGATVAMLNMVLGAMGDDDEGNLYMQVPEHTRENNLILLNPFGRQRGVDGRFIGYISIPLPYGYSFFYNIGRRAAEGAAAATWKDEFNPTNKSAGKILLDTILGQASHFISSFSPIGSHPNLPVTATPTMLRPFMELGVNENFTGRKIIPPVFDESEPQWSRYYPSTSEFWRDAARLMSDATGGDVVSGGLIDVSPEALEHLFKSYTGGVGSTLSRTFDLTLNPSGPVWGSRRLRTQDVPILRRFLGSETSYEYGNDYYAIHDRMKRVSDARRMAKNGDPEAREWLRNADYERRIYGPWKASEKRMKALRDRRRQIDRSNAPASEKSELIQRITDLRSIEYRRFVRMAGIEARKMDVEASGLDDATKRKVLKQLNEEAARINQVLGIMSKEVRGGTSGGNVPSIDTSHIDRLARELAQ